MCRELISSLGGQGRRVDRGVSHFPLTLAPKDGSQLYDKAAPVAGS